eukprot:11190681-Lingulodinium_polyedra.AAC.1
MELRKIDLSGEDLPEAWRVTAVKCLLAGKIKERVELTAGRIKTYDHLRKEIMKYAARKRLEK